MSACKGGGLIQYLGHLLSAKGIRTDPEEISKVKEWARPTNQKDVLQFLEFSGYNRRYIKGCCTLAAPLYLRRPQDEEEGKGMVSVLISPFRGLMNVKPFSIGYPEYSLPFVLQTDASGGGLGAVLSQIQQRTKRVIAYASRGFSPPETRYPAHKLEFLALKWPVTDKFYDHLYRCRFSVLKEQQHPKIFDDLSQAGCERPAVGFSSVCI